MASTLVELERTHIYHKTAPTPIHTPIFLQKLSDLQVSVLNILSHYKATNQKKQAQNSEKTVSTLKGLNSLINTFREGINGIYQRALVKDQYTGELSYNGEHINVLFLENLCEFFSNTYVPPYENAIKKIEKFANTLKNTEKSSKILTAFIQSHILELQILAQNLSLLDKFEIWARLQPQKDDILTLPIQNWNHIENKIEYSLIFKDLQVMEKQMYSFLHMISITNAVCYKTNELSDGIQRSIYEVMYTVYFRLFRNKSFNVTDQFFAETNKEVVDQVALRTWNGMDKVDTMRYWFASTLPWINYHQKLYLHKSYEGFDIEDCVRWQNEGFLTKKQKLTKKFNIPDIDIYKKTNKSDKVKVRVISSVPLVSKIGKENNKFLNFFNKLKPFTPKTKSPKVIEKVIIHIHGGGWVSMSSFTHQMYTRRWARSEELKDVPIISIDYRKAPQVAYPGPLEDCWQVYLFVVNELKNFYNINPKKIILTGDSAGGNMALGICQLCEKYNVQKPHGVFLSYPAVNTSDKFYTPSINKTMSDLIVPFAFLDICMNLYINDKRSDPLKDTLLSPLVCSPEQLKKLPPLTMIVGEQDCLKDDGIRFLDKLVKSGHQQNKMIIYTGLKHGFLNWDIPLAMPITRKCGHEAAVTMAKMFNNEF